MKLRFRNHTLWLWITRTSEPVKTEVLHNAMVESAQRHHRSLDEEIERAILQHLKRESSRVWARTVMGERFYDQQVRIPQCR